jgi:hypothetical protein
VADKSLHELRAHYRAQWDAYQIIAHRNREIVKAGKKPTDAQVTDEARAVAAVEIARDELLAAISLLGH